MAEVRAFDPFANIEKLNQELEEGSVLAPEEAQRLCDLLVRFVQDDPLHRIFSGHLYQAIMAYLRDLAQRTMPDEKTDYFTWRVWEIKEFFTWEETIEKENPYEIDENDRFSIYRYWAAQEYEEIPHTDSLLIFRNDQSGLLLFYLREEKDAYLSLGGILRSCINEVFPALFVREEVTKRFLSKEHRILKNDAVCTPELAWLFLAKEHYVYIRKAHVAYNCKVQATLSVIANQNSMFQDDQAPLVHLSKVLSQLGKENPKLSENLFERITYVFRIAPMEEKRAGDEKIIEMEANATFSSLAAKIHTLYDLHFPEWSEFATEDGSFRITNLDDMRGATRVIPKTVERTISDALLSDYFRRKRCLIYQWFFFGREYYRVERLEVKRSYTAAPD